MAHGCFDLLHPGHIAHLEAARALGDHLIVSITADRFISKGPGRPHFNQETRAKMLSSLRCVDEVRICEQLGPWDLIRELRPNIYVKGADYEGKTGDIEHDRSVVESVGGRLVFTDTPVESSSRIINAHFNTRTDAQNDAVERVRDAGGIEALERALAEVSRLSVLVVGESIEDEYVDCTVNGVSSKHPTLSLNLGEKIRYAGGAAAIKALTEKFGCKSRWHHDNINHVKTRYLVNGKHVFETTSQRPGPFDMYPPMKHDAILLADFGHSYFTPERLPSMGTKAFVALNVQTNSSNYGFNLFTKHKRFDYLVIDTREARLGVQDRWSEPLTVAHKVHEAIGGRAMALTAGPNGAYLFNGANTHYCPAFSGPVVDAIGAGDVYFAVTSLLMRVQADPEIVNFVGNVAAGLKTGILGHGSTVTKEQLLRACRSILA